MISLYIYTRLCIRIYELIMLPLYNLQIEDQVNSPFFGTISDTKFDAHLFSFWVKRYFIVRRSITNEIRRWDNYDP